MSTLESIIAEGNRGHNHRDNNRVRCADGFSLSVIAGGGAYCSPRPALCSHSWKPDDPIDYGFDGYEIRCDFTGPYDTVEVGYPSERPEPWADWEGHCEDPDEPTGTVYSRVPAAVVRALVESHGGEA